MIKIVLTGMATIKNLPQDVINGIKTDLTIDNPNYEKQIKNNKSTNGIDPYIYLYVDRGSSVIVPRGYMNRAIHRIGLLPYEIIDNTVCPIPAKPFVFNGTLRDYQEAAVSDCLLRRYGILEAATAAGKTIMCIGSIAKRQTRTLIIVHSTELLNQWKERIKQFLNYDVGLIGNGNFEIKDITVGIINSVHSKLDLLAREFGYVIYDETHRAIGSRWIDSINTLTPKYHLGVTATPFRSDGLTRALYGLVGPKLHVVSKAMLEDTGAILVPTVIRVNTDLHIRDEERFTYAQIISILADDSPRNTLIAETVVKEYTTYREPIMVVSDRVSHCEELNRLISTHPAMKVLLLHGQIPKKQRKEGVEAFKNGKYNVMVATASLISEGYDAPDLSSLFLTTPVKFEGKTTQIVGRLLRPSGSITPRVYDFRDYGVNVLRYSAFARDRTYKKLGWTELLLK